MRTLLTITLLLNLQLLAAQSKSVFDYIDPNGQNLLKERVESSDLVIEGKIVKREVFRDPLTYKETLTAEDSAYVAKEAKFWCDGFQDSTNSTALKLCWEEWYRDQKGADNTYTARFIEVYKVLKGEAIDTVILITEGGRMDKVDEWGKFPSRESKYKAMVNDYGLFFFNTSNEEYGNHRTHKFRNSIRYGNLGDGSNEKVMSKILSDAEERYYKPMEKLTGQPFLEVKGLQKKNNAPPK